MINKNENLFKIGMCLTVTLQRLRTGNRMNSRELGKIDKAFLSNLDILVNQDIILLRSKKLNVYLKGD